MSSVVVGNVYCFTVYRCGGHRSRAVLVTVLMAVLKKMMTVCLCERCGYEWPPRGENLPAVCASLKCKSQYWNRPRTMAFAIAAAKAKAKAKKQAR